MDRKQQIINKLIESFDFLINDGIIIKNKMSSYEYNYCDIDKNKKITGNNGLTKIIKTLNKTANIDEDDIIFIKNNNEDDWKALFPDHMKQFIIFYMISLPYIYKKLY
jgi:hypothetical protein